jgi:hypothetical protein
MGGPYKKTHTDLSLYISQYKENTNKFYMPLYNYRERNNFYLKVSLPKDSIIFNIQINQII